LKRDVRTLNDMREHILRHTEILNLTSLEKWQSDTAKLPPELCRDKLHKLRILSRFRATEI